MLSGLGSIRDGFGGCALRLDGLGSRAEVLRLDG